MNMKAFCGMIYRSAGGFESEAVGKKGRLISFGSDDLTSFLFVFFCRETSNGRARDTGRFITSLLTL